MPRVRRQAGKRNPKWPKEGGEKSEKARRTTTQGEERWGGRNSREKSKQTMALTNVSRKAHTTGATPEKDDSQNGARAYP